ncbi:MAG: hypothetical protein R3245_03865 [Kiloniellales bacterium]|nr:hypothetical protein [Kiloniellales bacterium]
MPPQNGLIEFVQKQCERPLGREIEALADEVRARHEGTLALLFYGSCLRDGETKGTIVDLYLIVEDLKAALASALSATTCTMLPPNVYYLETEHDGQTLRTKYAVLSLSQFERGTSRKAFHSYFWARFCQPTAIVVPDQPDRDAIALRLSAAMAAAAQRMAETILPLLPDAFSGETLWVVGFKETYKCELRAETPARAQQIVDADKLYFLNLTKLILNNRGDVECEMLAGEPRYYHSSHQISTALCRFRWFVRMVWGKILSVLRLMKAAFTFDGGARYLAWKIERHSGQRVMVKPWMERHPILGSLSVFWRLYKKGAFR